MENQVFYKGYYECVKKFTIIKEDSKNNENIVKVTYFGNDFPENLEMLSNSDLKVLIKYSFTTFEGALQQRENLVEKELERIKKVLKSCVEV